MTSEQISVIQTIAFVLDKLGSWPLGTLFFASIIGPWIVMFLLQRAQDKRYEKDTAEENKRFEAVVKMYESNLKLVEGYEKMAENQQDLIIMNTQAMQGMLDSIKSNLFCPIVRQGTEKKAPGP